ncbi:MAG TPA: aminoglycoside phosphotransferase family protein [Deltaproteobacteria bacterium]|nr:aminoglycoside phosphotransferase family protein [Deltaproteobacteria bacterium]
MRQRELPEKLHDALMRSGLIQAGEPLVGTQLTGGVSSDIWRIETTGRIVCVKRALPKLKVQQDWFAPVERNRYEHRWYRTACNAVPGSAPKILAFDDEAMLFAMEFLPVETHPLWKERLLSGSVDPEFAGSVGRTLGKIHAATADSSEVAAAFATQEFFEQLRLDPYLRATGTRHPELVEALHRLADDTAAQKITLVHGDVSPKNILIGPNGPVFLDAECAWYGDPAFDLAFCLNHLLLKTTVLPEQVNALRDSFDRLRASYLAEVVWERPDALEVRTAALLPGLFLARVDGKSPLEYITEDHVREQVRRVAVPLILNPPKRLQTVAERWHSEIE